MTNDEAIKTFRKDYCGEKFFCELHQDGLCNTEECEIWCAINALEQPDIAPDGTLKVTVDADIANVGRILLSQTGTQRGGLYYKDEQPEETCGTCKYGYSGDGMCDYCRVMYPSNYERRTDD